MATVYEIGTEEAEEQGHCYRPREYTGEKYDQAVRTYLRPPL